LKVSGSGTIVATTPPAFIVVGSGTIDIAGSGRIYKIVPLILDVIGSGGIEIDGEYESYIYHTWVINGPNFEPAFYSGFNFNSYSAHKGYCYGLKSDGLYLLDSNDDDGEEIHAGVNIGAQNFGKEGKKALRTIQFGDKDGDDINVKVSSLSGDAELPLSRDRKITAPRSVYGDTIDISIADFERIGPLKINVVYK